MSSIDVQYRIDRERGVLIEARKSDHVPRAWMVTFAHDSAEVTIWLNEDQLSDLYIATRDALGAGATA